ncbi:hypothetical protein FOL47_008442 [Perkinsus chesapeaki]|uniref:Response regulatory domain-containing protein n=1 Tax=Perkinsus chesapeaki TaxID=330153 RepID=A0A7J6LDZ3_PERCH|nr:hypothetical protein FOL47_008442 [Perkinsus chesapeaki]
MLTHIALWLITLGILVNCIKYPVVDLDEAMAGEDDGLEVVPPGVLVNFSSPQNCDGVHMPATASFCVRGQSELDQGFEKFLIIADYFDINTPAGSPAKSVRFGINATFKGSNAVHLEQLEGGCATIIDQSMYLSTLYINVTACTSDLDGDDDDIVNDDSGRLTTASNFTVFFEVHFLGVTVVKNSVWARAATFAGDDYDMGLLANISKTFNEGGVAGAKCDADVKMNTLKNRIDLWQVEANVDVMVWVAQGNLGLVGFDEENERIYEAEDGQEALDKLDELQEEGEGPVIVLLDLHMTGGMDGHIAAEKLKEKYEEYTRKPFIVCCSAEVLEDLKAKPWADRFHHFAAKPMMMEVVEEMVASCSEWLDNGCERDYKTDESGDAEDEEEGEE